MRFCAFLFGIVFIALGIAGFIAEDSLFGILRVNLWLNALHLLTGIVACCVGFLKIEWIRLFFQLCGIVYVLLALLGFAYDDQNIFGIFASNAPISWLHMIAAVNALILGYGSNDK